MKFIEKYGEICRGIDCRNIKSCQECKIGKKLNLCAEYEDTGLTPEEIQNDIRIHKEMWEEKYYAMRNDRDYWEHEAKKWRAKLGEIRIMAEGGMDYVAKDNL